MQGGHWLRNPEGVEGTVSLYLCAKSGQVIGFEIGTR